LPLCACFTPIWPILILGLAGGAAKARSIIGGSVAAVVATRCRKQRRACRGPGIGHPSWISRFLRLLRSGLLHAAGSCRVVARRAWAYLRITGQAKRPRNQTRMFEVYHAGRSIRSFRHIGGLSE
jgi:hypothetical protein